jgi:prolipoprotein diacylglyceryltransferase
VRLRRGSLLLVYFVVYSLIRFLLEFLRTDTDWRLLGLSRNGWVSLLVMVAAAVFLAVREGWLRRRGRPDDEEDEKAAEAEEPAAS